MMPRGVRNCNPGNIRVGQPWAGLAKPYEMTPEQKAETAFCVFRSPEWGIRAMAVLLRNYRLKYHMNTIAEIIERWAPPSDNNATGAYIAAVAKEVGIGPNDAIDTTDPEALAKLIPAIIRHENGQQPYSDATIRAGIALAKLSKDAAPQPKPLVKSKRVAGTAAATGTIAVLSMAGDVLRAAGQLLEHFGIDSETAAGAGLALFVGFIAFGVYILWTAWIDHRPQEIE